MPTDIPDRIVVRIQCRGRWLPCRTTLRGGVFTTWLVPLYLRALWDVLRGCATSST